MHRRNWILASSLLFILVIGFVTLVKSCSQEPLTRAEWQEWWMENRTTCRALEPYYKRGESGEELLAVQEVRSLIKRLGGEHDSLSRTLTRGYTIGMRGEGIVVAGWSQCLKWRPLDQFDDPNFDTAIRLPRGSSSMHLEGDWWIQYVAQ